MLRRRNLFGSYGLKALYKLPSEMVLDGATTYIDTGIQLLKEPIDFTICFDVTIADGNANSNTLYHCMTEASPYPGIGAAWNGSALSIQQQSGICTVGNGRVTCVVIAKQGKITTVRNQSGNVALTADYPYRATDKNFLIGCYQMNIGAKGRFFKGTLHDFRIYDCILPENEIVAFLGA